MLKTCVVAAATSLVTTGAIVNVEYAHRYLPLLSSLLSGSLPLRFFVYVVVKSALSLATQDDKGPGEACMQRSYAHAAQIVSELYLTFLFIFSMA